MKMRGNWVCSGPVRLNSLNSFRRDSVSIIGGGVLSGGLPMICLKRCKVWHPLSDG